jgi:hypothetical protein
MIVLDTHIWVRWLDPEADPLPASLVENVPIRLSQTRRYG